MSLNVLFLCSRNRLRSPTAEQVFADSTGVETASAGLSPDADHPLAPELLDWADLVFVMEPAHRRKLAAKFGARLRGKRVVCLGIPDDYDFMAPELVRRLKACVPRHLPPA
ncbi:phosphotyrosine protein phosphatase [Dokdonella sp.]|uniref:low molecular weight protein tyrosine phosphatase family protein n=1 Tax=Dokdonella sp. TaxID=2291710 RepID=UPI00261D7CE8|nr:phosphotyrosine protein phosphatase [Dokdonella sp.]